MTSSEGGFGRGGANHRTITVESTNAKEAAQSNGARATDEDLEGTTGGREVVRRGGAQVADAARAHVLPQVVAQFFDAGDTMHRFLERCAVLRGG